MAWEERQSKADRLLHDKLWEAPVNILGGGCGGWQGGQGRGGWVGRHEVTSTSQLLTVPLTTVTATIEATPMPVNGLNVKSAQE